MRLDQVLVQRGMARSRSHAQDLIAGGHVTIVGFRGNVKASTDVSDAQSVHSAVAGADYVGRAAYKLSGALGAFPDLDVSGRVALDAGACTGGFTQVLLENGVRFVYAVDVGHGQLSPRLSEDTQRVANVEGTNLRDFERERLPHPERAREIDLVVGDVSFISLTLILPRLVDQLHARDYVLLVKPQFEVGRGNLSSGGIVTDPVRRANAIETVAMCGADLGLGVRGIVPSQVTGAGGNSEYVLWLAPEGGSHPREWTDRIRQMAGVTTDA